MKCISRALIKRKYFSLFMICATVVGCYRYSDFISDKIGAHGISDEQRIVFYRIKSAGNVRYATAESPGRYTAKNREYDVVQYFYNQPMAEVVTKVDGMKLVDSVGAVSAELPLSFEPGWISRQFRITPRGCNSVQMNSGVPAYACPTDAGKLTVFSMVRPNEPKKTISLSMAEFYKENERLGGRSSSTSLSFEYLADIDSVIVYSGSPIDQNYQSKTWRFLVQRFNFVTKKSAFYQLPLLEGSEISAVGFADGRLQFLVRNNAAFDNDLTVLAIEDKAGSVKSTVIANFDIPDRNDLPVSIFIPKRNEIYFATVQQGAVKLVRYNYNANTTMIIPVQK